MNPDTALEQIVTLFENLRAEDVARLGDFYANEADFKDPFNEVRGLAAIQRIFAHMFVALERPRFVITGRVQQGQQCFLTWEFVFAVRRLQRGAVQTVRGATHLELAADGRITRHRDYWDPAEEIYQKLPLLGGLMRWLQRQGRS